MLEAVAAEVLGKAVTSAGIRVGSQIKGSIRRRRNGESDEDAVAGLLCAERALDSKRLVAVDFPSGIGASDFKALLDDPTSEAIAFELLAATLAGSPDASRRGISDRWVAEGKRLLPELAPNVRESFLRQIFDVLKSECDDVVLTVFRDYPGVVDKVENRAHYHRITAILEAIERRLSDRNVSGQFDEEAERRFLDSYSSQAIKAHGFITPPDFERRKRIPIAELYVSPSIKRSNIERREEPIRRVEDLIRLIDRTVLLGDPGNGKSTAAAVTMYTEASKSAGLIPIMVVLREFAPAGSASESVLEHIEKRLNTFYQCPPPAGLVENLLSSGRCLVIFDGLDELLDTSRRREVTDTLELFCSRYPLSRVLVTSRRVGYLQAPMDPKQFDVFEIAGFDESKSAEYVEKWFKQDESLSEDEVRSWSRSFMEESQTVDDLRSVPLLLALMCIIYRGEQSIPRNRPAVYEKCATMLFEKWDSHRKIHVELRVGRLVDPAMKFLGYWMLTQQDETEGVTESTLVAQTSTYLQQHDFEDVHEAEAAAKEFVEFCRGRAWVFSDAGSTADGEALYKFTHRTFMEYFAGYHLTRAYDTPERLAKSLISKVADAEWDVVAQLAIQIEDKHKEGGAERFYRYLLEERVRRSFDKRCNLLSFLCRCLPFVTVKHSTLRLLIKQVVEKYTAQPPVPRSPGTFAITAAVAALMSSASGPRQSVIEDEWQSNLLRQAISKDAAVARSALYASAFAWTAFHTRDQGPVRLKSDLVDHWLQLGGTTFDAAYQVAPSASRQDDAIRCLAWARGHLALDDLSTRVGVEGLAPLWNRISLPHRLLNINSYAQGLIRWFFGTSGNMKNLFIQDPIIALSDIGAYLRRQESVTTAVDVLYEGSVLSGVRDGASLQAEDYTGLSPDALLGGLWLSVTNVCQMGERNRKIFADRTAHNVGRARRVYDIAVGNSSIADVTKAAVFPAAVTEELSRWALAVPRQASADTFTSARRISGDGRQAFAVRRETKRS